MAVAVQDVARAKLMDQLIQADYPILADTKQVADAYGVFNLFGDGIAAPAVFVINPAGQITWSYIGKHADDRPSPSEILTHLSQ